LNDHDEPPGSESPLSARLAELALALGVVLLGAVMIWQTTDIRVTPINSRIGPRVIPYVVGAGMTITGIWLAIDILRGRVAAPAGGEDAEDVDPTLPTDWRTVGILSASLIAYLFLIERGGFVIASTVLFFGAAFGMGSRRYLRDLVIGFALALAAYLLFTEGLSLRLPEGILPLDRVV
jgi:putative tricarboxylic transport membrane protein